MPAPLPSPTETTRDVRAVVVAVLPEYRQAKVRSDDGHLYAIDGSTQGVRLEVLREGQWLRCLVTVHLPRVLRAQPVA